MAGSARGVDRDSALFTVSRALPSQSKVVGVLECEFLPLWFYLYVANEAVAFGSGRAISGGVSRFLSWRYVLFADICHGGELP